MRMNGAVGRFIHEIDQKAYLYDNFQIPLADRVYGSGLVLDESLSNIIIALKINTVWEFSANYFLVERGVLKILPYELTIRNFYSLSNFEVGSWIFRLQITDTIPSDQIMINFIYEDSNNKYFIIVRTDNDIRLGKKDNAVTSYLITPNFNLENDTWYVIKVTRDSNGNFELFIDDESKGTVQDAFIPNQRYIWIENGQSKEIWLDYIKVI